MVLQKYPASLYSMESPEKKKHTLDISDLDKQKSDNHFLTQHIQELKWESEQKDRIIEDLQTIVCNLKSRLRANNLDDDVQLCEEEIKQGTHLCQNVKDLLEKVRLAESITASLENREYIENIIKENENYKKMITDLQIRLYSGTSTNNIHKIELMNLQHDVHEFSQRCHQMSKRLMACEKINFPPMSNDFSIIEENKRLRNKILEVQEANKKWRAYNNQREDFYRKFISQINSKKETSNNSTLTRNVQHYDEVKKNEEELLALKTQVKIYAEDFENERKDREKAQSRISDLESEILKLKHLRDPPHEQPPLKYYMQKSSRYVGQKEAVSRGLSESLFVNHAYQKDSLEPVRKHADKFETDGVSNTKQNFICPSCNMVFGSDKQAELLAHVDICF